MHVFSKPVNHTDGIEQYVSCSNSRCKIYKNFVFMQCCAHCLNIYCTVTCCNTDEFHTKTCLSQIKHILLVEDRNAKDGSNTESNRAKTKNPRYEAM